MTVIRNATRALSDYIATAKEVVRHPYQHARHYGANVGAGIRLLVNAGVAAFSGQLPTTAAGMEFVISNVVGTLGANFREGFALAMVPSMLGAATLWGPSAVSGNPWHAVGLGLYTASVIPGMAEPWVQEWAEKKAGAFRAAASEATRPLQRLTRKVAANLLTPFAHPRWWFGRVNNAANIPLGVQDIAIDHNMLLACAYPFWWWGNRLTARSISPSQRARMPEPK